MSGQAVATELAKSMLHWHHLIAVYDALFVSRANARLHSDRELKYLDVQWRTY